MIVFSFPPVIDERSKLLILGSMPGVASLRAHQYYGHPRNHFWPILYALFAGREPDPDYERRLAFALDHGIALWDSIAACEREGSLDAGIKDVVPNDIPGLLRRYPQVRAVVCNGNKSYAELTKHHGAAPEIASRIVVKMPSTSPVPTARFRGFRDKLEAWRAITDLA
ncbi:DNA-deoxyinosine glycosylase [Cohnella sp. CFH 77786]|uniref:DNA-deoxyinosine glycosylase n=1 Tax=Cohnella sp. CFH 77786 TaxID=2662265 RepID=UPI001C610060|nr:DNA-deoxyinosine glycosylase [Cohnella sp. CFH 77786]MBW5445007.1 DNA-deoxyinosine glycosylase [Cohnella sp. CFH 77786]